VKFHIVTAKQTQPFNTSGNMQITTSELSAVLNSAEQIRGNSTITSEINVNYSFYMIYFFD